MCCSLPIRIGIVIPITILLSLPFILSQAGIPREWNRNAVLSKCLILDIYTDNYQCSYECNCVESCIPDPSNPSNPPNCQTICDTCYQTCYRGWITVGIYNVTANL